MYYSLQLLKLAAHIPSDVPWNFRCSKLLTNLSQNPWLDPNLPATYCWYRSWWNSSASWTIFFQVLLQIFSIERLLLKMLQALCVSNSPPSLHLRQRWWERGCVTWKRWWFPSLLLYVFTRRQSTVRLFYPTSNTNHDYSLETGWKNTSRQQQPDSGSLTPHTPRSTNDNGRSD